MVVPLPYWTRCILALVLLQCTLCDRQRAYGLTLLVILYFLFPLPSCPPPHGLSNISFLDSRRPWHVLVIAHVANANVANDVDVTHVTAESQRIRPYRRAAKRSCDPRDDGVRLHARHPPQAGGERPGQHTSAQRLVADDSGCLPARQPGEWTQGWEHFTVTAKPSRRGGALGNLGRRLATLAGDSEWRKYARALDSELQLPAQGSLGLFRYVYSARCNLGPSALPALVPVRLVPSI